jgi:hypothetical protein
MQQLKALFEGNKVETELFVAHVNEISAAGWVIKITKVLPSRTKRNFYVVGQTLFMSHSAMSDAELLPA